MINDIYEKFVEVCNRHHIKSFIREYAFGIYIQKVNIAIKEEQSSNDGNLSSEQKKNIFNALVNEQFILDYAKEAETNYHKQRELDFRPYFKENSGGSFWKSVFASVVGGFFYSVLLVIIFYIAQDQIGTWLQQLANKK